MPRQLLARGRLKITTNDRISIVPQTSENVFQLRFNPILNEDGGEYRCVFNHKTGVKYKVVVVNIQGGSRTVSLGKLGTLLVIIRLVTSKQIADVYFQCQ